eukprot:g7389.t1
MLSSLSWSDGWTPECGTCAPAAESFSSRRERRERLRGLLRANGVARERWFEVVLGKARRAAFPVDGRFVLLDAKQRSLDIARRRVADAGLRNVVCVQGYVEEYDHGARPFDLGLALHACGDASDAVLERCVAAGASYVVCPCCVGKLQHGRLFDYPRSAALRGALTAQEYDALARAADHQHEHGDTLRAAAASDGRGGDAAAARAARRLRGRRMCKSVVECDRNALARESGYVARVVVMHPPTATPKNDIIVGWLPPRDTEGGAQGSEPLVAASLSPEQATGWADTT